NCSGAVCSGGNTTAGRYAKISACRGRPTDFSEPIRFATLHAERPEKEYGHARRESGGMPRRLGGGGGPGASCGMGLSGASHRRRHRRPGSAAASPGDAAARERAAAEERRRRRGEAKSERGRGVPGLREKEQRAVLRPPALRGREGVRGPQ